ncbi:hypothetical protein [Hymenobacter arizonensis]|uniref:Antitoxin VbhA domain-containing protein n=1 Tax=Hymenobacter arizonensis TaxID=1227077 RepID=A0A1I6BTE6_HYMAR|nr:hypothetical protein [Hymenobacter arizonensis]SFQ84228.1 hypothetical protein SAMN04515668_5090 [Hymenobacter arizonensis]
MSQDREPQFCETERTPEQRLESVQWAFGVSASAGGAPSPEVVQLYERYILGEIDMQHIDVAMSQLYPQYPSNDPYAGRWTPNLDVEPARPVEVPPGFEYDPAEEEDAPAGPEMPAALCAAQLRAFVQDIVEHLATQPPRQRYIQIDV